MSPPGPADTLTRVFRLPQLTEADRAAARTVTSTRRGHQFEIQLGHLCNERCVFCSSGQLTAMKLARHVAREPIFEALSAARRDGARRVTFVGGEPTLHRAFHDALAHCVALGFDEIVIFTNGVLLPHPGFVERVVALGFPFEWRISIQGGHEAAHVAVTGRADSFRRIVEGLARLREHRQRVTANVCLTERNWRSLPDYPALVRAHGVRQLHVDIVRPSSTGERTEDEMRELLPRYSVMAPALDAMLARFDRDDPGFDVSVGNVPFCVLPAWAHRIEHGGEETVTQASDTAALEQPVDKYAWHASLRRHPPQCAECVFRPRCTGVFEEYLGLHGAAEFVPVSAAQLRSLDPAERSFTTLVAPLLAPLEAALRTAPPDGWTLRRRDADARSRRIDMHLAHASGAGATLRFVPSSQAASSTSDHSGSVHPGSQPVCGSHTKVMERLSYTCTVDVNPLHR